MEATLIQPNRVKDEGPSGRKLLLLGDNWRYAYLLEGTKRISTG